MQQTLAYSAKTRPDHDQIQLVSERARFVTPHANSVRSVHACHVINCQCKQLYFGLFRV